MGQNIAFVGERHTGIYTAAKVRAFDRYAIDTLGIDSFALMTSAANDALNVLLKAWPDCKTVRCFCGAGNNGGDGLVLAALAKKRGLIAEVVLLCEPAKLQNDAKKAYMQSLGSGVRFLNLALLNKPSPDTVIVDALLGTGQNRAPEADFATAVEAINNAASKVIALDIPTGLCADSGKALGAHVVNADMTVTFIALKQGLLAATAWSFTGALTVSSLNLPAKAYTQKLLAKLLLQGEADQYLQPRKHDSHKGSHGHCLIAGGNQQYIGAPLLSSTAALRSGAGLVSVLSHPNHASSYPLHQPELMSIAFDLNDQFEPSWWQRFNVVAVGPGLGQDQWAEELLHWVLDNNQTVVLDADALNLIAAGRCLIPEGLDLVLTPHPAEAARLLGCTTADIQADRFASGKQLAEKYNAVGVLKGAGSIVSELNDEARLILSGNAGLSTGGSGDVLTGIIASLIAQGLSCFDAAVVAAYKHGEAADICEADGQRGMLPSDIIDNLRKVLN